VVSVWGKVDREGGSVCAYDVFMMMCMMCG
jgi:hypothetical protein